MSRDPCHQKSSEEKHKVVKGAFYRFDDVPDPAVMAYTERDGFIYPSSGNWVNACNLPLFSLEDHLYLRWRPKGVLLLFKCLIQENVCFLLLQKDELAKGMLHLWEGEP